jgi:putative ABC transport system substrate-binding protein
MIGSHRRQIVELALKNRLPAMLGSGLIGYGTDFDDLFRRVAEYVVKTLRGAKAADLPVEQPTKFTLVINLKTAKTLGLTIPPALLLRADQVIE